MNMFETFGYTVLRKKSSEYPSIESAGEIDYVVRCFNLRTLLLLVA